MSILQSFSDLETPTTEVFKPLERVIGQPLACTLLERAILLNQIAPAYLFAGFYGVGKRLMARCFCQCLIVTDEERLSAQTFMQKADEDLKHHPDLLWIEPTYLYQSELLPSSLAQSNGLEFKSPAQIRIEQIREITHFLSRPPLKSKRLLVVMEAAQTLNLNAAKALLKTLEEPGQATLILVADNLEPLPPTILSRCQLIPFHRLSAQNLKKVLVEESRRQEAVLMKQFSPSGMKTGSFPTPQTQPPTPSFKSEERRIEEILAHSEILEMAQGSPGQAIAHWKKLQSLPPELLNVPTDLSVSQQLALATMIAQSLSLEEQLWLTDYWQRQLWRQTLNLKGLQVLSQTQSALLKCAQSQLLWEVSLANLVQHL